jgi:Beta-propeller domains of methanol dehydrogenase type
MKNLIYNIFYKCGIIMLLLIFTLNIGIISEARHPRVYDEAGLFTEEEIKQIEDDILIRSAVVNIDMIVVTTNDANGKSSRVYADDYYDELYFAGGFGDNAEEGYTSGILYLINMDAREIYLSTDTENELKYTDAEIENMLDRIYTHVAEGNFAYSCKEFVSGAVQYGSVSSDSGVRYNEDNAVINTVIRNGLIALGIATAVTLVALIRTRKKQTTNKNTYLANNGFKKLVNKDLFIRTTVVKRNIQSSNSGSTSRTSTHKSSSGRSHGGGGRKF